MERKYTSHALKKAKKKSNRKSKEIYQNHSKQYLTKEKCFDKSYSDKSNNILKIHNFDEVYLNINSKNNKNLTILNSKSTMIEKFSEFLNKKKFKLSNNFDEKNSKKFLDKKDKCLERIIISDIIENENSKDNSSNKNLKKGKTNENKKSFNKYFIVISNYDEEMEFKNTQKKRSINMKK